MSRPWDVPDPDADDPMLPDDDWDQPVDTGRRPRKRPVVVIALVLVVALAFAGTSLFWMIVSPTWRAATAGSARPGDCLLYDQSGPTYRVADCDDAAAEFRLLGVALTRDGCVDVPGASRVIDEGSRFSCVGEKAADPATALNGIVVGDCVANDAGRAVRAACGASALPVLAVVRDVPRQVGDSANGLVALCQQAGATDVRQTYAWALGEADGAESASWDRLLCLGAAGS